MSEIFVWFVEGPPGGDCRGAGESLASWWGQGGLMLIMVFVLLSTLTLAHAFNEYHQLATS